VTEGRLILRAVPLLECTFCKLEKCPVERVCLAQSHFPVCHFESNAVAGRETERAPHGRQYGRLTLLDVTRLSRGLVRVVLPYYRITYYVLPMVPDRAGPCNGLLAQRLQVLLNETNSTAVSP